MRAVASIPTRGGSRKLRVLDEICIRVLYTCRHMREHQRLCRRVDTAANFIIPVRHVDHICVHSQFSDFCPINPVIVGWQWLAASWAHPGTPSQLELSSWRGRIPEKASRLDDSETPASFEDARCSATATASVKHPLSELLTSSETILCAEAQIVS